MRFKSFVDITEAQLELIMSCVLLLGLVIGYLSIVTASALWPATGIRKIISET